MSSSSIPHKPSASARIVTSRSRPTHPSNPPATQVRPTRALNAAHLPTGERLSKIMAERGLCSRREADSFIERGLVWVDGVRIRELGTRVRHDANIVLEKTAQVQQDNRRTILLNKPIGYVSGQPEPGYTPAVSLIRAENYFRSQHDRHQPPVDAPTVWAALVGLAPAGRLDIDSTGLLVLTQDGRIARQLIGDHGGDAGSEIDKEYLVRVDRLPNEAELRKLNHGLALDGKALRPAQVQVQNDDQLMFVLREGKKRQIRRMCELVGLRVLGLKRVRIGRIKLANLPVGQWRFLAADERF